MIYVGYTSKPGGFIDPLELREGIEAVIGVFASSTGELFIGKKDLLLYRVNMHLPIDISTSPIRLSGAINTMLDFSQFNTVSPIRAPNSVTLLESIMGISLNESRSRSRDAKRISDVGQIQLGLELYFDTHQKYPPSLSPLVNENFLSSMPLDPTDNNEYAYHQLEKGESYVLGASLENEGSVILENDVDALDVNVFGYDFAGCDGGIGRYCYDVSSDLNM